MEPHSTHSQFNHRSPKSGPMSRSVEFSSGQKSETAKRPPGKTSSKASKEATANLFARRPIATNSRVKQDELFKRDMYLSFVSNALQQKINGISDTFDELVSQFTSFSPPLQKSQQLDTAQIRLWLLALSHVVSRLERIHSALVDAIVNMPWTTLDNATVKSYTVFIGMLLSARPEYLSLVLSKIAQGFTYQAGIQALDLNLPSTSNIPLTRRVVYDRLHYLLQHIISLVPTLPSTLQPLLVRFFPHKRQNQLAQTTYIRNLLRISSYCPELADKIIATIVDRAIQIDVEIQIELDELDIEELPEQEDYELDPFDIILGQEPDHCLSDSEDDDSDGDDFSDLSSEAEDLGDDSTVRPELPMNMQHIQDMVKKLDGILYLLFEHFDKMKQRSSRSVNSRPMSPIELPPLPPLESSFLEFGPPSTQNVQRSISKSRPTTSLLTSSAFASSSSTTSSALPDKSLLRAQFHSLLSIFDRTILPTFKSRYTQFLVFWYASLDPEFADVFQGMLVERALMPSSIRGPISTSNLNPSENGLSQSANAHLVTPELTRAAAASYIGSFVSRATFIDREGTRQVVAVLCEYLRAHLDAIEDDLKAGLESGSRSKGLSSSNEKNAAAMVSSILTSGQHGVFYAVSQAVFLIFCFRWRDLLGEDDEELDLDLEFDPDLSTERSDCHGTERPRQAGRMKDKWMPELSILKRIVTCILNPLKVCSPNVVMQFARVAQATDFIYCYTILETNKRKDISVSLSVSKSTGGPSAGNSLSSMLALLQSKVLFEPAAIELTTFFPFDPYRLPKSNVFIQGVYREWSSVAIDDEDDEDEDDEDSDPEDLELEENVGDSSDVDDARRPYLNIPKISTPGKSDDGGLGESFGAMSISPARMSISVGMR